MKIGSLLFAAYAGLCAAQVMDQDLIATDNSHNICLGKQGSPTLLNVTITDFITRSEDRFNITFSGEDGADAPPALYSCPSCAQCGFLTADIAGTPENIAQFLSCVADYNDMAKCGQGFPESAIATLKTPVPADTPAPMDTPAPEGTTPVPDTPVPGALATKLVCVLSGKWTQMTLQEQLAKGVPAATGANPIVQSIAAMSGACTDWSYQMMKSFEVARVTITAEQDNWFNGCVANKLLPTCKMWPAEVYTYSASAKYDVCLSKGGESTLNDTTVATFKNELEPFLQTFVAVTNEQKDDRCADGSGLLEVMFGVATDMVTRFESCLADSSSVECNGFPDITSAERAATRSIIFRLDNVGEKDVADANLEVIKTFVGNNAPLAIGLIGGTTVFNENAVMKAAVQDALTRNCEPLNMGDALYNGNTETNVTAFVQRGEIEGVPTSTFAPISGRWDSQLLTTLKQLGYRVISASAYLAPTLPTATSTDPMQLSAATSAYMTDNGAWVPRSVDAIVTACADTTVCVVSIDVGNNKAKPTPEAVADHMKSLIAIKDKGYSLTTFKEYWALQAVEVKVCVGDTWTMKNLETDMGKFTGSAVAASTFVADTCGNVRFVTKKPAKLTTLKVLGKELDKVKACLMDRSAAACATFPDMVYPYAMPMTYHVCLNRGDAAKLTDALYDKFVTEVQAFAKTYTKPISREDSSPRCPAGYGLVVLEFAATPMKRTAFEGCLDGKSSSCEGFPKNAKSAGPVVPPPTPSPEDDGFPMWAIIVMAVTGGLCLCMTLVYFCKLRSKPHFQMNFGEQCGALDEMEDEYGRPMHTHEYHEAHQPAV